MPDVLTDPCFLKIDDCAVLCHMTSYISTNINALYLGSHIKTLRLVTQNCRYVTQMHSSPPRQAFSNKVRLKTESEMVKYSLYVIF